ncbi:Phospholipase D [Rhynchospora pubera]|uniref:phospholipase D n=1 Tax=Rhynchospora pubera TaxID=906938 RepID=A0AAV8EN19_9POAL|nr:Phospholipase D [Rhynchospora pubera]
MDGHPNPYPPPYTPYEYPPPNQPPTGPYLAQPASFPSHPHNLAPQFNHSGPLLYRPPAYSPTTYDNRYPPSPPAYPDLNPSHHDPNLYHHLQHLSFQQIGSGQYDSPNMHPELNQNPSGFQHAGSDRYDMPNHSSYSPHSCSDSISLVHDGGHILDSLPSLKVLLLHGSLEIIVRNARNLPNMDIFHEIIGNWKIGDPMTSDPYVTVSVSDVVIACTYVKYDNENPEWDQHFFVPVAHEASAVLFTVKDDDTFGAQIIGTVSIPAETIYSEERIDEIFPLLGPNGKPCNQGATLSLLIQYIPVARLRMYPAGPDCKGVANTYFPLRRGGKVTLYQDAHVPENCLPKFWLENGVQFQHGQCWRDMFDAISRATKFIYIAGWSVLHTVTLVRDGGTGNMVMLGDLLKRKSQEGVRVCLLIWDDRTSRNILGLKLHGFMHTNDEQTRQFFKHSSVNVLLCPRTTGKKNRFVRQQEAKTIFTHHQKTVLVDADAGNYRRKIIAFVGGLDLCGGRYDNPAHHLFRTLDTIHKDDFYNPNFKKVDNQGPREPWHDLHSKIDSPAAYDILTNFVERWLKALKWHERKIIGKSSDDTLLNLESIPEIYLDDAPYMCGNDPESWDVQV